ncbi:GPI mannosyltransferase 1 [Intoshia linei]|uniref:GPI alpha-1,4-mannosyltransferase I, catalytic subunit n=1 Tax=Intoshia linei TaxID=1819745 RepID=A0A177BC26_9BILA|nr:GPI mannosyltransferase 1 [Intoshia linei]
MESIKFPPKYYISFYTDIDYLVFTEAGANVLNGKSPYLTETYRYSPLIAYIFTLNVIFPHFARCIFATLDVFVGTSIYYILNKKNQHSVGYSSLNWTRKKSFVTMLIWIYNPFTIQISTRGSAESLTNLMVIWGLCYINKHLFASSLLMALAIQTRLYPIILIPCIYFYLSNLSNSIFPNIKCLIFLTIIASANVAFTFIFYKMYGFEFIQQTLLYHVSRLDVRHNMSPYFYFIYLLDNLKLYNNEIMVKIASLFEGLLSIFTNVVIVILAYLNRKNLILSCFLVLFIFVTFNRVITSQYFIWFLPLFFICIPHFQLNCAVCIIIMALFFVPQIFWLNYAFLLEIKGINTFTQLWISSIIMVFGNTILFIILHNRANSSQRIKKLIKDC